MLKVRKIISAALALALAVGAAAAPTGGEGLFAGSVITSEAAAKLYTSNLDAGLYIREQLKKGAKSFSLDIKGKFATAKDYNEYSLQLLNYYALGYTGDGDAGDGLVNTFNSSIGISYDSTKMTINYNIDYSMTSSQMTSAKNAAAKIEKDLGLSGKDDYGKIKAVHDYLAKNIKYDKSLSKRTLYDALVGKRSVCDGYAHAFYKIMNDVGVPCRIMTGTGNGGAHAWNTVYLAGKWYFIDVTWDSNGYEQVGTSHLYDYFLKSWKDFGDHRIGEQMTTNWLSVFSDFAVSSYTKSSGSSAGFNYPILTESGFGIDISKCSASLSYSSYGYDGNAKRPTVTVKSGGMTLKQDKDYTVTYSNNVKPGTATVTIKGKGEYRGTLKKTYHIGEVMSKITIPYASYTYTGSAITPTVTVKDSSGRKLTKGTDYTVKYSSNTQLGTAKITIIGKGRYGGTRTKTFVVKPAKNAIRSITTTKGAFKLTWNKAQSGTTGYQVLYSTDKNFAKNVHSYTSTNLSDTSENFSRVPNSGETWYVKVRSFITKDGKATSTRYGNYSAVRSIKVK